MDTCIETIQDRKVRELFFFSPIMGVLVYQGQCKGAFRSDNERATLPEQE